ncbi:hypothetical protein [Halochromatium glycolicum]|uniref:Uncharacterized protein n=1 Tax=Halochromatium glycolicum TaxID=85075 RepID=A0AAJ0U4F5_9GAMM|nr:hypothetical protein [Halochromatium glycolicum]MBK1705113.1 hypothetical protein [Halochromatium glycolicum]
MTPLQAQTLYDLASGAHAAAFAAQAEDDLDQRYGLLAALEHLTSELKRITWSIIESVDDDLVDDGPAGVHRVTVPLTRDEYTILDHAAAAAQQTPEELLAQLIRERIRRAANRVAPEGDAQ